MKYIAVFCSAVDLEEKYIKPAKEFARLLAKQGYHLVWGGSNTGLMEVIASEVQAGGGKLIGVTVEVYKHLARENADEMIFTENLGERKATMLLRSDAIAVLVGGVGTLDELTEIIELKKQRKHSKPVVVLNTENFYEGLKTQLQKINDEGFIKNWKSIDELVIFANEPQEAMDYLNSSLQ